MSRVCYAVFRLMSCGASVSQSCNGLRICVPIAGISLWLLIPCILECGRVFLLAVSSWGTPAVAVPPSSCRWGTYA